MGKPQIVVPPLCDLHQSLLVQRWVREAAT